MNPIANTGLSPEDDRHTMETIRRLNAIGYPVDRDAFKTCEPIFDENSQTLSMLGHPVMERWEDPYMARLAEIAASGGGRILEVGFGMGISAGHIQRYSPREHVIIEANALIAELGRQFAEKQAGAVTILEGFWEDVVPVLAGESFDGILFDTYPLSGEEVDNIFYPFVPEAYRLLKPGGVFTYFSDEATDFSPPHREVLKLAGFGSIQGHLCSVNPPPDCDYWRRDTILAPEIRKAMSSHI